MNFPQAVEAIIDGKKVTRSEWESREDYGLLKDGFLMIYTKGAFHQWLVSDGDMLADDWVVIPDMN